jgi:predicted O-methyltransferase YrrM
VEEEELSLFKGKNFVFDQHCVGESTEAEQVTGDVLGRCFQCGEPCSRHTNCSNLMCGGLILQCPQCAASLRGSCSEACRQQVIQMESMTTQQQREYRKQQAPLWMPPVPNALAKYRSSAALSRGLHTRHFTASRALSKSIEDSALQNDYVYSQSSALADDALLRELRDETAQTWPKAEQLVDELQGKFLSFLVQTTPAQRVLEIGCFTGYSALCLANGLASDGTLVTCDIDADAMQFAQRFFDRSSRAGQIAAVNQDGLEYLNALAASAGQPFDVIFVDANKRKYRAYLDVILEHKLLRPSGLLVFDNTLFRGRVAAYDAGCASNKERIARGLAEFNSHVAQDPRVSQVLLPLWDGLTLVRQATESQVK